MEKLMAAKPKQVRVLLKKWWNPRKMDTLAKAYPSVDWGKVTIRK